MKSRKSPHRFIIIHRFFWPHNLPYAHMLRHIAQKAIDDGFDVEVFTTHENSGDLEARAGSDGIPGLKIHSIKLSGGRRGLPVIKKLLDAVYFGAWVFLKLLIVKPNLVLVPTTPPVVMAAIVRWAGVLRGFDYIYHCQDIHPEAMRLNNNIDGGWIYRLLYSLDCKNLRQAKRVIVLSNDMKETLSARGCSTYHVKVINNFVYEVADKKMIIDPKDIKVVRFLFAGTLGFFQNLDILLDAIARFSCRTDVEFSFMGDGPCRRELEIKSNSMQLKNVFFLGQRKVQEALSEMSQADYGIVSIAPNIARVAYPSKTMMYLSNGLPIFAIVDEGTEIFQFINEKILGVAVVPNSASEIADAIELAIKLCKEKSFSRPKIVEVADDYFGKNVILNKYSKVFAECKIT